MPQHDFSLVSIPQCYLCLCPSLSILSSHATRAPCSSWDRARLAFSLAWLSKPPVSPSRYQRVRGSSSRPSIYRRHDRPSIFARTRHQEATRAISPLARNPNRHNHARGRQFCTRWEKRRSVSEKHHARRGSENTTLVRKLAQIPGSPGPLPPFSSFQTAQHPHHTAWAHSSPAGRQYSIDNLHATAQVNRALRALQNGRLSLSAAAVAYALGQAWTWPLPARHAAAIAKAQGIQVCHCRYVAVTLRDREPRTVSREL